MGIQSAKSGGHLTGLAYLDTALGVNPVVKKLPYSLQEGWIKQGLRIHNKPHPLAKCRRFRAKHLDERKAYIKERSICFRCCASTRHIAKVCKAAVKCSECNSDKHLSALHPGPAPWSVEAQENEQEHGREQKNASEVTYKCTEICSNTIGPRSCSKICLVQVYPANAVLDVLSNRSLFSLYGISGVPTTYTLRTCSGVKEVVGRKASNFVVASLEEKAQVALPPLPECNMIPDGRSEIPTPDIAQHFSHLTLVANKIPLADYSAPILLLLGRDVLSVHKVCQQYNGPHNTPYAQCLDIGWVIVGLRSLQDPFFLYNFLYWQQL